MKMNTQLKEEIARKPEGRHGNKRSCQPSAPEKIVLYPRQKKQMMQGQPHRSQMAEVRNGVIQNSSRNIQVGNAIIMEVENGVKMTVGRGRETDEGD